jgi:DNA-binding transcriptional ArsR family regulator
LIRVPLDAQGVARIRFSVSPVAELSALLALVARPPQQGHARGWADLARETVGQRRLGLLSALAAPPYLPDFLSPPLDAEERSIQDELELVHATEDRRIVGEIAVIAKGRPAARIAGRPLPRVLTQTIDKGISVFLDRLCEEMYDLWRHTVAPRWSEIQRHMDAAISAAAITQARGGTGAMLASLHPGMGWASSTLFIQSRYEGTAIWARGAQLAPSVLATRPLTVIDVDPLGDGPCSRRDPLILFPVFPVRSTRGSRPDTRTSNNLEALLGCTRARLLADLRRPCRTTDLAARHRLAPGAVSYHLGILTRAGVTTRRPTKDGVFYQASPLGLSLLAGSDRWAPN